MKFLGERVGHHGHRLVVRSKKKDTADRRVVEGHFRAYGDAGEQLRRRLRVFVTGGSKGESPAGQAPVMQVRARRNVWLEFGWMWSFLRQRERMLVLTRGEARRELEIPSDAQAIEQIAFEKTPAEQGDKITDFIDAVRALDEGFSALG